MVCITFRVFVVVEFEELLFVTAAAVFIVTEHRWFIRIEHIIIIEDDRTDGIDLNVLGRRSIDTLVGENLHSDTVGIVLHQVAVHVFARVDQKDRFRFSKLVEKCLLRCLFEIGELDQIVVFTIRLRLIRDDRLDLLHLLIDRLYWIRRDDGRR